LLSAIVVLKVYPVSVPESMSVGSRVIQVRAVDPDAGSNAALHYVIASSSSSSSVQWFSVDAETGLITLAKSLDRERVPEMQFGVSTCSLRIHDSL